MEINTFGTILRKKRKQCGLSQYQLGMLLKVSDKAVSKWENDLARPKSQLLYQLTTILGINIDELFAGEKYIDHKKRSCISKEQHGHLWNKAYSNLMKRYADKPPIEMISRFEMEKLAFMNTDMIFFFDLISKISENALKKGCPVTAEGGIGASFVAYLLGASDVNPLPAHYYCPACKAVEFVPEAFDGWELEKKNCNNCHTSLVPDGHNIPFEVYRHVSGKNAGFDLVISRCFYKETEEMILQYFGNDLMAVLSPPPEVVANRNITQMKTYAIQTSDMQEGRGIDFATCSYDEYYNCISDKPYINLILKDDYEKYIALEKLVNIPTTEIDFWDKKVQQAFYRGDIGENPNLGLHSLPQLFHRFNIKNMEDVLQLYGVALCASVFSENEVNSYIDRQKNLSETITYRDDVFLYICSKMKEQGYLETGLAYKVMDQARKGNYSRIGMDGHVRKLLLDIGVSEQYIACLEETTYLFPKAQGIIQVKHALILLWYKIHYPKEYDHVFSEDTSDYGKKGGT